MKLTDYSRHVPDSEISGRDLVKVQDRIQAFTGQLLLAEMIKGVAVTDDDGAIDLDMTAAADTVFKHRLGRVPTGWIVTDNTDDTKIFRVSWDSSYITLNAPDSNTTIRLWVF